MSANREKSLILLHRRGQLQQAVRGPHHRSIQR